MKETGLESLSSSLGWRSGLHWRTVSVDTPLPTFTHTRTPSPTATPTLTSPRPPSLPLEDLWGAILTSVEPPCQRLLTRRAYLDIFPRVECWDCRYLAWEHGVEAQVIPSLSMREMQIFYWLDPREGLKRRRYMVYIDVRCSEVGL